MFLSLPFSISFLGISISIHTSSTLNPLNGQHLRVIWTRWKGNPKGLPGPLKGGAILETLADRFNFTYQMVRVNESLLDPPPNGRGLYSYLWENRCDLLVHEVTPTYKRIKIAEHTMPWAYEQFAFLIPVPDETANLNAIIKPFQWPIWLGLGVSIICVITVIYLMRRYLEYQSIKNRTTHRRSDIPVNLRDDRRKINLAKLYLYVLGNLLSQGGPCPSKRSPFRLVAGVWALSAFIFVQAYSATLFTYVVTPITPPLINSVSDIADNSDINLLVREAGYINTVILTAKGNGLYGKLRDRLNSFEKSVCPVVSECVRLVTPGSKNVYVDAKSYLKDVIRTEYSKTGVCKLQLAKENFFSIYTSFGLPKNSPYTQTITKGILEMQESGLLDFWDSWFRPMPPQCNGNPPPKKEKLSRLSLNNLTGAFIILLVGTSLSLLAFLCEIVVNMSRRRRVITL